MAVVLTMEEEKAAAQEQPPDPPMPAGNPVRGPCVTFQDVACLVAPLCTCQADGLQALAQPAQATGGRRSRTRPTGGRRVRCSAASLAGARQVHACRCSRQHRRTCVRRASALVPADEMMAVLGPSGAGKTTLLEALAGRKTGARVQGSILYAGRRATPAFLKHSTGYVEQVGGARHWVRKVARQRSD